MRRLRWLPLLVLALTSSFWPQNDERILDYHSDITVNPDGSMDVRETIKVRARGQQIKRGIYRDFPTTYQDRSNHLQRVTFQLLQVLRDGRPEGSRVAGQGNGVRIYVGKPDVFLPPGEYAYTIAYRTTNQLSFFEDHDELYWNVTGNGWDFFIDQASAAVTLPGKVPRRRILPEGYTGPQGAKSQDLVSKVGAEGKSTFQTTKALAPHEGLTIVVSFPKGFVTPPPPAPPSAPRPAPPVAPQYEPTAAEVWATSHAWKVGVIGLLVTAAYYLLVWWQIGRDPTGGAIMPLYEPPKNFSPAALRYLTRMGFDDKTFAAAVLSVAVKGHFTITQDASEIYTVEKKENRNANLAPDEVVVVSHLVGMRQKIELKSQNHATIYGALTALEAALGKSQRSVLFSANRWYVLPGVLLAAVTLFCLLASLDSEGILWSLILCGGVAGLTAGGLYQGVLAMRGDASKVAPSLGLLALAGGGLWLFSRLVAPSFAALLGGMGGIHVLFFYLLSAPTRAGRRVLDQVEGFKMFLTAVEGDRLRMQGATEKTPELFEKYLPYALALDVEHQWAEQFTEVFARAAQTDVSRDRGYSPSWYLGPDRKHRSASDFAKAVGPSLSRAVASSSTAPGSQRSDRGSSSFGRSSGSGGRGSSGGGGGGGGGGGW